MSHRRFLLGSSVAIFGALALAAVAWNTEDSLSVAGTSAITSNHAPPKLVNDAAGLLRHSVELPERSRLPQAAGLGRLTQNGSEKVIFRGTGLLDDTVAPLSNADRLGALKGEWSGDGGDYVRTDKGLRASDVGKSHAPSAPAAGEHLLRSDNKPAPLPSTAMATSQAASNLKSVPGKLSRSPDAPEGDEDDDNGGNGFQTYGDCNTNGEDDGDETNDFFNNGVWAGVQAYVNQEGGAVGLAEGIDDFEAPAETKIVAGRFQSIESDPAFVFEGTVTVSVHADTGAGAPEEDAIAVVDVINPTRTLLEDLGAFRRYRYDFPLDISLPSAGTWWVHMRPHGSGTTGQAFWAVSQGGDGEPPLIGNELHWRSDEFGFPDWTPGSVAFEDGMRGFSFRLTLTINDCNNNNLPDECDIEQGAPDCNTNGVPDECEPGATTDCNTNGVDDVCEEFADCNGNGALDECDIGFGTSDDCNANGAPDECELGPDCNSNGVPDECDLIGGTSDDCNTNDVLDVCEVADIFDNGDTAGSSLLNQEGGNVPGGRAECSDDFVASDTVRIITATFQSVETTGADPLGAFNWNGDVIVDLYADNGSGSPEEVAADSVTTGATRVDLGAFGATTRLFEYTIPLALDVPSVGTWWINIRPVTDGTSGRAFWGRSQVGAAQIIGNEGHFRAAGFGFPTWTPTSDAIPPDPWGFAFTLTFAVNDCNFNGVPDACDIAGTTSEDCNTNDMPDDCEAGALTDCNTNSVPDLCEEGGFIDCNDNGTLDECDLTFGTSADCNNDGLPDDCDPDDCNENGVPDDCDITGTTSEDCNSNDIPDECDPDCNTNDVPDDCDLAGGAEDCNTNAVPDECDISDTVDNGNTAGSSLANQEGGFADTEPAQCADDLTVPAPTTITGATFQSVETDGDDATGQFNWNGDIIIELFADTGSGAPQETAIATVTVQATRVNLGDFGPTTTLYEYTVPIGTIDIPGAGTWWISMRPVSSGTTGRAFWGRSQVGAEQIIGNEGYFRSEAFGIAEWTAVSALIPPDPWGFAFTLTFVVNDCNDNGIPDACDIDSGFSEDADGDGIPDECQDCNTNGLPDPGEGLPDCNGNSILDECEIGYGTANDCDSNAVPDDCQPDCNLNGVADECDIAGGSSDDCNTDLVPDECDLAELFDNGIFDLAITALINEVGGINVGMSEIVDDVTISDPATIAGFFFETAETTAAAGLYDWIGEVSVSIYADNAGTPSEVPLLVTTVPAARVSLGTIAGGALEVFTYTVPTNIRVFEPGTYWIGLRPIADNLDGNAFWLSSQSATFGNIIGAEAHFRSTLFDFPLWTPSSDPDAAGEAIGTSFAMVFTFNDCNLNLVLDECDIAGGSAEDCDTNGVIDACQVDCNGNGVSDACDIVGGTSDDIDGDGVPDECQADCNTNDFPDDGDISSGDSSDCNTNGVPDECDVTLTIGSDVAYTQLDVPFANLAGIASDEDITGGTAQVVADDFYLDDATLTRGIIFLGGPLTDPENGGDGSADTFTVRLWTSNGVVPDSVEYTEDVPSDRVTRIDFAPDFGFIYLVEFAAPVALPIGPHWLEVVYTGPASADWFWFIDEDQDDLIFNYAAVDVDNFPNELWPFVFVSDNHMLFALFRSSEDSDANGVPDECGEVLCPSCPGDVDADGFIDGDDVQGFVDCLLTGSSETGCDCADADSDGDVDADDLDALVDELLNDPDTACP